MKNKLKLIFIVVSLAFLFAKASFFVTPSIAEDRPLVPTIVGYSQSQVPLDYTPLLWAGLYNPPIDERANPELGKSICSVETNLTFPKDIIEVDPENFIEDDDHSYSNTNGTIAIKNVFSPCTTDIFIDLFTITFNTKALGSGTIVFSTPVVTGGGDGTTVLSSGVYSDIPIEVIPVQENQPEPEVEVPSIVPPSTIPSGISSRTSITPPSFRTNSGSNSSSSKTASKTENSAFQTPALTKLEFGPDATLDKANGRSKGAVFTGTAEPNHKIIIQINSESEILTETTSGADGLWTKTINGWIEDGTHTVTIWSEKDEKISPKFSSKFVISSYGKDQIAIGTSFPEKNIETPASKPKKELGIESLIKNKFFWVYTGTGFIIIALSIFLIIRSRRRNNNFPMKMDSGTNATPMNQDLLPPQTTATTPTTPSFNSEDLNKPIDLT